MTYDPVYIGKLPHETPDFCPMRVIGNSGYEQCYEWTVTVKATKWKKKEHKAMLRVMRKMPKLKFVS